MESGWKLFWILNGSRVESGWILDGFWVDPGPGTGGWIPGGFWMDPGWDSGWILGREMLDAFWVESVSGYYGHSLDGF